MHWDFRLDHPTIWVFFALVLVLLAALWMGAHKSIAKSLDVRSEKIRKELEDAERLRAEAQDLLASYKRKLAEAEEQAKGIVEQARIDADNMAEQARKELDERIARRAEQAEAKIAVAEAQAMNEVKAKAVELATKAAEDLIKTQYKTADHTALVKAGIADLGKALN